MASLAVSTTGLWELVVDLIALRSVSVSVCLSVQAVTL